MRSGLLTKVQVTLQLMFFHLGVFTSLSQQIDKLHNENFSFLCLLSTSFIHIIKDKSVNVYFSHYFNFTS